ncbi:MAG: PAS domain S-box protein, partial [Deltaproteobacteria bacterium]|nr:PAS domain S-box protein [Deltaproteobacteria bacterium]
MLTIDALKAETAIPAIIVDRDGTIVHINEVFEETWGWRKDQLVGESLTTIIPDNLRDAHHMGFSRFAVTGKPTSLNQALELIILKADCQKTPAEHYSVAEEIDGNW